MSDQLHPPFYARAAATSSGRMELSRPRTLMSAVLMGRSILMSYLRLRTSLMREARTSAFGPLSAPGTLNYEGPGGRLVRRDPTSDSSVLELTLLLISAIVVAYCPTGHVRTTAEVRGSLLRVRFFPPFIRWGGGRVLVEGSLWSSRSLCPFGLMLGFPFHY